MYPNPIPYPVSQGQYPARNRTTAVQSGIFNKHNRFIFFAVKVPCPYLCGCGVMILHPVSVGSFRNTSPISLTRVKNRTLDEKHDKNSLTEKCFHCDKITKDFVK